MSISGVTPAQETAVLNAVATVVSKAPSFNVFLNTGIPYGQPQPVTAATLSQAMDTAHAEAQALATKAGGTLGNIVAVKQMNYTGPLKAGESEVELEVTYQLQ